VKGLIIRTNLVCGYAALSASLISPTRPLDSSNLAPKHYTASPHPSTRDGLIPLNSNMDLRNDDDGKG
jgi:hypothetical protein